MEFDLNAESIRSQMPADDIIDYTADLFKIFGDSTRMKILFVLYEGELSVGDIAEVLNMSQSAISHQLRILKSAALVKFIRDGKTLRYSLADSHVKTIIAQGMDHVSE